MADNTRIDELRRRLEKEPGSRLFAQLAEELRKEGELTDAIRVARTGLLQHPAYPSAHMTLGMALRDTGDLAGARVQFEAVLHGAPDNILASRFLGEILEAMGDLGSALLQYRATLRLGDRQVEGQIRALEERLNAPAALRTSPALRPETVRPTAHAPAEPSPLPARAAPRPVEPPSAAASEYEPVRVPPPAPPAVVAPPLPPPTPIPLDLEGPLESAPEVPSPPPPSSRGVPTAPPPSPPPAPEAGAPPVAFAPPSEMSFDLEAPFETAPPAPAPSVTEPAPAPVALGAEEPSRGRPPMVPLTMEEWSAPAEPALTLPPDRPPGPPPVAPAAPLSAEAPALSSSTLAELYFRQGFVEQAIGVYRELLQREPDNERVKTRLAEITAPVSPGPPPPGEGRPPSDARSERRRVLEQTIAHFEGMLAVLRRG